MNGFFFRNATQTDLNDIIYLLNQDCLAKTRESLDQATHKQYEHAMQAIIHHECFELLLMEDSENHIVACAQLMYLPHLSFQGSLRMQIESVRVEKQYRGQGLGQHLLKHCIALAKQKQCKIVQLTSNHLRSRAQQFYIHLGFEPSHTGFKLYIE